MRTVSRKSAVAAVSLIAAAVLALPAGPASADPPVSPLPAATDLVSVGSHTTYLVDSLLSTAYNSQSPAPASKYYSWDAVPPGTITTKTGAVPIPRPSGTGLGYVALNDTSTPGGVNVLTAAGVRQTVDILRSSRGPQNLALTTDTFIEYAEDAIGWAGFTGTGTTTTDSPATLSYNDLAGIFSCTITSWNQITDIAGYIGPNAAIKVVMPPAGSDTRALWLTDLGLAGTFVGTCWNAATPVENEGTDAVFDDPAVIFPYSTGHYVGQVYKGLSAGTDAPGSLDALRQITGAPLAGGGTAGTLAQVDPVNHAINTAFANTRFGTFLYHVVLTSDWIGAVAETTHLKALLGKSTAGGWICKNGASVIAAAGFLPLNAVQCGFAQAGTY